MVRYDDGAMNWQVILNHSPNGMLINGLCTGFWMLEKHVHLLKFKVNCLLYMEPHIHGKYFTIN